MRYRVGLMAALAQRECEGSKLACHLLGQRVSCEFRLEVAGLREDPLDKSSLLRVHEIVKRELMNLGNGVGPVRVNAKPLHIADDQERWVAANERLVQSLMVEVFG